MKRRLIIADDNFEFCKNIFNEINLNNTVDVIGIANDGEEALKLIYKYKPDFLILDLNMPKKTGIEILKSIESIENLKISVIIISGEIDLVNKINIINHKFVSNIIIKPFSIKLLNKCIEKLLISDEQENIDQRIVKTLEKFSFNQSSVAYAYLVNSIKKVIENPMLLDNIENKLYKEIEGEGNLNRNQIKWGIQKLMSSMLRYTDKNVIIKYFPYNVSPSPKIFIKKIVDLVLK